ncbi:hypothetical protein M514_05914 [Trichuris suis]|uniref:Derlin n=1 Tax=Trichuris suis TaxID=68888 RepID=A0A085MU86_9BILA|nr:hypothetical protein M514_05914 [Trichuris suis]
MIFKVLDCPRLIHGYEQLLFNGKYGTYFDDHSRSRHYLLLYGSITLTSSHCLLERLAGTNLSRLVYCRLLASGWSSLIHFELSTLSVLLKPWLLFLQRLLKFVSINWAMAEGDLVEWLRRVPEITRYWFVGTVLLPILARFNVVKTAWFVLDYELVVHHFQIWRPVTALFIYPITPQTGFQYLIMLYFLYNYSTRLETAVALVVALISLSFSDVFPGRPADYLFMLIFNWFCAVIIGLAAEMYFLLEPMVLSVLYVWCQHHAEMIVQFYFGTQFKAMYLPWILMLFNLILRGSGLYELVGIFIGYLYYFLTYRYPEEVGGESLLRTPSFLYRLFPSTHGGIHGFGRQPDFRRRRPQDDRGTHNWGHGHVLGGN